MILVDTSAWIEVLRGHRNARFAQLESTDEIVTCLPVMQEVLQGFDDEKGYWVARSAFETIRFVESPLSRAVFTEAVQLYRQARRAGLTIRSGVDCLIAACAIRNGAKIVHSDRDFEKLARVSILMHEPL